MFFLLFRPPKSFLGREWSNIGGEGFLRKGIQSGTSHQFDFFFFKVFIYSLVDQIDVELKLICISGLYHFHSRSGAGRTDATLEKLKD